MSSHAGNSIAENDLVMMLYKCRVMLMTVLLSPTGDGAAESCDEDTESY
jgi:hypothetical protein